MNNKMIWVLGALLVASLMLLGKVAWDKNTMEEVTSKLNKQLMQADEDKNRALTQFGDAERYIDELETKIQEDIKEKDGQVQMYGELVARHKKTLNKLRGKSRPVKVIEKVVEYGAFQKNHFYVAKNSTELELLDELNFIFDKGWVKALITVKQRILQDPILDSNLNLKLDLRYKAKFVESHTPSGAINHYATIDHITPSGKKIGELKIEDFKVVVLKPEREQWFWWAPHLDIGLTTMAGTFPPNINFGGSIGLSFFGYGKTLNDLNWRALRLSTDLTENGLGLGFSPALYNVGQLIPLISNLWIGPHLNYRLEDQWSVGFLVGGML